MTSPVIDANSALGALLAIRELTDLLLVGSQHTFIDCGRGLDRAANPFRSDSELSAELMRLAAACGARLDLASPMADFNVGPLRFHAVLPAGVSEHPLLSIRRHPQQQVQLSHLLEVQMFDATTKGFLELMLERRENFLISGATGSGKTTLLSALLHQAGGRTICLEQVSELRPPPPGLTLTEREANIEGRGRITIDELLVNALRMRPDRVVVGEVRGTELKSLLQAMNNGHAGSGATLHAAELAQVANRLILLGLLSGTDPELTGLLVASGVDWIIQLDKSDRRRIADIGKPELVAGELRVRSVWSELHLTEAAA